MLKQISASSFLNGRRYEFDEIEKLEAETHSGKSKGRKLKKKITFPSSHWWEETETVVRTLLKSTADCCTLFVYSTNLFPSPFHLVNEASSNHDKLEQQFSTKVTNVIYLCFVRRESAQIENTIIGGDINLKI